MNAVLEELLLLFPRDEVEAVRSRIVTSQEFAPWKNETQIWASIIILSGARLVEFEKVLEDAANDWRDIVIAAGLAVDEWEQVAMKWLSRQVGH